MRFENWERIIAAQIGFMGHTWAGRSRIGPPWSRVSREDFRGVALASPFPFFVLRPNLPVYAF
jgi:hypothetical protein